MPPVGFQLPHSVIEQALVFSVAEKLELIAAGYAEAQTGRSLQAAECSMAHAARVGVFGVVALGRVQYRGRILRGECEEGDAIQ